MVFQGGRETTENQCFAGEQMQLLPVRPWDEIQHQGGQATATVTGRTGQQSLELVASQGWPRIDEESASAFREKNLTVGPCPL